jgi:plastocyanin
MTHSKSRTAFGFVAAMLLGAATVAAILPRPESAGADGVREIRLVVRDMTYYADGGREANPTLLVRRGERVRILLRNEDAGMTHDFTVPAWEAATRLLQGRGETVVEFRAPDRAGQDTYACTPHGEMMRGTIRVE